GAGSLAVLGSHRPRHRCTVLSDWITGIVRPVYGLRDPRRGRLEGMAHTLSAPERELIDSICARYATWAPEEPGAPHMEHAISAGLSNQSFLLQGTQRYVLRIAAGAEPPGVNRHREKLFHESAASASLAPPIRLIDAKRGLLITDYLEPAMNNRGTAALAELLRGIHKLNIFESSSSLAHRLQLWDQLRKDDSAVSQLVESRGNVYEDLMHRVSELDETPSVPCHNDLLAANRRQGDGRLMAIDWEYADCGHPFFDLAVCGSELARSERLQL
ncbi:unnamed protein product, partial [Ectocarpus sp. 12 AP-2014]